MVALKQDLKTKTGGPGEPLDPAAIDASLALSTPVWPLQNAVAVNPFWNLREDDFYRVLSELSPVLHASLFMPLEYYRAQYNAGAINSTALQAALDRARATWPTLPADLESFLEHSRVESRAERRYRSFAEQFDEDGHWHRHVVHEVGKFAAAYFDRSQALAAFPFREGSFWEGWLEAIRFDRSMQALGAGDFARSMEVLRERTPAEAIAFMLAELGIRGVRGQTTYLQRLLASVLGWASQFSYQDWQRARGYDSPLRAGLDELLAVRLAYDYGLFLMVTPNGPTRVTSFWQTAYNEITAGGPERRNDHRLQYVWLEAFEGSFQKRVAERLQTTSTEAEPEIQMAFCIDVRSELIRRRIEEEHDAVQTVGFAGFFGLPLDYRRPDELQPSARLPVLLPPALQVSEDPRERQADRAANWTYVRSFFRNLRKNSFASFLYVEVFGLLSVGNVLRSTFLSLMRRLRGQGLPPRFDQAGPDHEHIVCTDGTPFDAAAAARRAAGILSQMGIQDRAARLVLLVGHGSVTVNNAFASALDCGACGGHAGDVNARVLARTLNRPDVRAELRALGIDLSADTYFMAGVHETVTDNVYLLETHRVPISHQELLGLTQSILRKAASRARRERQGVLSGVVDRHVERRMRNWAEVRPEWGLTGNAAFIVAPRWRTRSVNLAGRSFLHDYDWSRDADFKILEGIMTAPMVVTSWINLQYYASTVAPAVFGAGNKLLHNLVGETGVLEGNGGDLRIGLPFQSVHDGERFIHEPLRLSVFIEAPRQAIEAIIARHEVVRQLVDKRWLQLLQIEPESGQVALRAAGGSYAALGAP